MKKLNTQITAIICAVILGGSFLLVQINKQSSIEKQKLQEIALEKLTLQKEEKAKADKEAELNVCLSDAEIEYWDYMYLNGKSNNDGTTITAKQTIWDIAESNKQRAEDNCYKRYSL